LAGGDGPAVEERKGPNEANGTLGNLGVAGPRPASRREGRQENLPHPPGGSTGGKGQRTRDQGPRITTTRQTARIEVPCRVGQRSATHHSQGPCGGLRCADPPDEFVRILAVCRVV